MTDEIVIVSAARTAVGSFNGAFAATPAHELGAAAIKAALTRAKADAGEVDEVILGQVLTTNQGQNPARQAAIKAGVPQDKTAFGLNQVCGSGLRAEALGMQQIANGDAKIVVAGGQESMSLSQHGAHLRGGSKMGDLKFVDTMIRDGLTDVFNGYHMGQTAENVAAKWQLSRDEQDKFALASQNKAEAAQKAGRFKEEIVPFTISGKKGDVIVELDEYIRAGTTLDALAKLKPAFTKDGTVTAGNASGLNDGAAAVILMSRQGCGRARADAACADCRMGKPPESIRRSWAPVLSPLRARCWKRRTGRSRISISSRRTKPSRHRPWPSTRTWVGIRRS
jgi:acetyl-CoA C-acetyltransferase